MDITVIKSVIDEMTGVATGSDESSFPEWLSGNRDQIDKWQAKLREAISVGGQQQDRQSAYVVPASASHGPR